MKHLILSVCLILFMQMSVSAQTNEYDSIHDAAAAGSARSIIAFIQQGVSVNLKDSNGRTPLIIASDAGKNRVISILLDQGANLNEQDSDGNTALHLAAMKGYSRVVSDLISSGANSNIKNKEGLSAKELAEKKGQTRIVMLFPDVSEENTRYQQRGRGEIFNNDINNNTIEELLKDPNQIRARLLSDPNLVDQMKTLFVSLENEEKKWTSRDRRIKNTIFNALRKEIDSEIIFIQKIAKEQDANDIVLELDMLQSRWKGIFSKSSRKMREGTRGTLGQQNNDTRSRGRSRRPSRTRDDNRIEEVDPDQAYIDSWGNATDTGLDSIINETQTKLFTSYGPIRELTENNNQQRVLNAIDGVLLERKLRTERSLLIYNLTKDELSNQALEDTTQPRARRRGRGDEMQMNQTGRRRR